jgi:DNA-binding IscR family transcriptional regulator
MMTLLAQHFQRGDKPPGANLIASTLGVPSRLISQLVQPLLQAKLIVEVADTDISYAPARPLDQITAHDILAALRVGQGMELETRDDPCRERVREKFDSICETEREMARAVTLELMANGELRASNLDKVRMV